MKLDTETLHSIYIKLFALIWRWVCSEIISFKISFFGMSKKKKGKKWVETINIHPRHSENSNISHEIKAKARREKQILPSTQEGAALVVPATCPGKQEHLTVWERSSILFLLQQRCAAMTSQVPALTCTAKTKQGHKAIKIGQLFKPWLLQAFKSAILCLLSPLALSSKKM